MSNISDITIKIKQKAKEIGFDGCGISKAEFLTKEAKHLAKWLEKGYHAGMSYMENHFDKRTCPEKLVEGTKSVISVFLNYYPERVQNNDTYLISKYAYGEDYHVVIRHKLKQLYTYILEIYNDTTGRYFVDSAPVMEREWAKRSGLGWIGKNSLLINKKYGSYIFIGEILIDKELGYDEPVYDHCGDCTRCINACPVNAITVPGIIDSNKCISYQTIENKGEINASIKGKYEKWIFGCDICQDVCPWNNKKIITTEIAFNPSEKIIDLTVNDFNAMNEDNFNKIFKESPVKRTGYTGLKRNINFVKDQAL